MDKSILWAPWRGEYVSSKRENSCIFCPPYEGEDPTERPIIYFDNLVVVMLNKFPYNTGHLLISPIRHVSQLEDLNQKELLALMTITQESLRILKECLRPDGFNAGFNLGKVAGAGYPDHIHLQVVPRWVGDVNFLTILEDLRLASHHYLKVYEMLKPHYDKLKERAYEKDPKGNVHPTP